MQRVGAKIGINPLTRIDCFGRSKSEQISEAVRRQVVSQRYSLLNRPKDRHRCTKAQTNLARSIDDN